MSVTLSNCRLITQHRVKSKHLKVTFKLIYEMCLCCLADGINCAHIEIPDVWRFTSFCSYNSGFNFLSTPQYQPCARSTIPPPIHQSRHNQKSPRRHVLEVQASVYEFTRCVMTRFAPECLPLHPSRIGIPKLSTDDTQTETKEALLRSEPGTRDRTCVKLNSASRSV